MDHNEQNTSQPNNLTPGQPEMMREITELRAELARYRDELTDLRKQMTLKPTIEVFPVEQLKDRTSRRRALRKLVGGAAAMGALSLATLQAQSALAENANDNAIDAQSGAAGYGGKFTSAFAQLQLVPSASSGKPANDAARNAGELYLDSTGTLYFAVAANTWRRLTASNVPGALTFFSAPDRFISTGVAGGAAIGSPSQSGVVSPGTPKTWTLGGQSGVGGKLIPTDAQAVFGNITSFSEGAFAVAYPGGGAIAVYPTGSPTGAATLVFNAGQTLVSNAFNSKLSASGQITFSAQTTATHFLADIVGYYQ